MSRRRSLAWDFFNKQDDNKVVCNICKISLAYNKSTTSLMKHLSTRHKMKYLEAQEAKDKEYPDVKSQSLFFPSASTQPEADRPTETTSKHKIPLVQQSVKGLMEKKMAYHEDSPRKQSIDKMIAEFVAIDMQPFSVVEDKGFRRIVNALDPRYTLPSRRTLTRSLLPDLYWEQYRQLKTELDAAEFVALTTDDWTSRTTKGYMAVTAHFINDQMGLISKFLEIRRITSSQTAEHIKEELEAVMKEWGITSKVIAVVTDNAANMTAAIKRMAPVYHIPCYAHTLNLVVQDSLKSLKVLAGARDKIRAIVSFFHHSTKAATALEEEQRKEHRELKKLKQEVRTRWNSTAEMIERFLELSSSVRRVLADLVRDELQLNQQEMKIAREAVDALKPFIQVTAEMSSEKTTSISKVIPMTRCLTEMLKKMTENEIAQELLSELNRRLGKSEQNTPFAIATFLDPRFMCHVFSDQAAIEDVKTNIMTLIPEVQTPNNEERQEESQNVGLHDGLWSFIDQKVAEKKMNDTPEKPVNEISKYEKESPIWRQNDPLEWWRRNGETMKELRKLAKKFLTIPATSTPSERLFSKAGELINQRRSMLSDKNINMTLFLNKNIE